MVTAEAEIEAPAGGGGDGRPSPFALLFAPDRGMDRQAKVGRVRWILVFAWVASLLLGLALAARVDAASSTLRRLEQSGQLQGMSDRQIADETRNAERVFEVTSVAKGAVGAPVQLGLACLAVVGLVWFFRGRIKGSAVAPVAAATLLPGAIASLLDAACALRYESFPPEGGPLAPRSLSALLALAGRALPDPWVRFGNALDFFSLWAAVMMGFGVAAAGKIPRGTAVAGTLVAWVCYRLLTQVAMGG
jgi:hypothetical protein